MIIASVTDVAGAIVFLFLWVVMLVGRVVMLEKAVSLLLLAP